MTATPGPHGPPAPHRSAPSTPVTTAGVLPSSLMLIAHVPGLLHPLTATAEAAWHDADAAMHAERHLHRGGLVVSLTFTGEGAEALPVPELMTALQVAARDHQLPAAATVTGQYDDVLDFLRGAPCPDRIHPGQLSALQTVTHWVTGSGMPARALKSDPLVRRHLQDLLGTLQDAAQRSPA